MCALLYFRPDFPWSHHYRGRAHQPTKTAHYPEILNGGLGVRRRMRRRRMSRNRAVDFDTVPPLLLLPHSCWPTSNLSTFRYIDLARSTGSQQDQNKTHLWGPFPERLHVAQIPVPPWIPTDKHGPNRMDKLMHCSSMFSYRSFQPLSNPWHFLLSPPFSAFYLSSRKLKTTQTGSDFFWSPFKAKDCHHHHSSRFL